MARIRTIKPDFFVSEDVSALPLRARLTWIGLWTHCDDHGRTKDVPKLVKAALWALDDVSLRDVEDDLAVLAEQGRIVRYTSPDGGRLLAVVGWHEHQAINRPSRSKHPAPPEPVRGAAGCPDCDPGTPPAPDRAPSRRTPDALTDPSVSAHGALPSGRERKGREQGGDAHARPHAVVHSLPVDKSTPPPLRCPRHANSTDSPPCGACADARRAHDAWTTAQRTRPTPVPGPGTAARCPEPGHEYEPAHACRACRADELATG